MRVLAAAALVALTAGCSDARRSSSGSLAPPSVGSPAPTSPSPTAATAGTTGVTATAQTTAPVVVTDAPAAAPSTAPATRDVGTTTPLPTTTGVPVTKLAPTSTRFFVDTGGEPFFWLGDTAWALPFELDRDEVQLYVETRATQGFNVIQTIAILNLDGWPGPNVYGDSPIDGNVSQLATTPGSDPTDADEYDYWDHLDFIVAEATARDMYVALVPIWAGDSELDIAISADTAARYGSFLAARYSNQPVIWMLGGDAPADGREGLWRELARGIATGNGAAPDHASTTMTYHPRGLQSSAQWFHDDEWLDFNMIQGGHCRNHDVRGGLIRDTYARTPPKPFVDGEPLYEGASCVEGPPQPLSTDLDIRREAFYSVFGGAAGHTYGHNVVYQFLGEGDPPRTGASGEWTSALHAAGAEQMRHLVALVRSRPFTSAIPDDTIVVSGQGAGAYHLVGTRASDGSYLMVYSPIGTPYGVALDVLSGDTARLWWFNPRTGEAVLIGETPSTGTTVVTAPSPDDWVLVADDAAQNFAAPGT